MQTRPTPFPTSSQPPVPTPAEVEWFRHLYQEQVGVDLDSATAARTLTDLAQFYFLTHGHERFRRQQTYNPQARDQKTNDRLPNA